MQINDVRFIVWKGVVEKNTAFFVLIFMNISGLS